MEGIDWKRYTHLCEELTAPAIERFEANLRKAAALATMQSISAYSGAMKGNLITVLRHMTDTLKKLARTQLSKDDQERINWKKVEDRMREDYFERLSMICNLPVVEDYRKARFQNKPCDCEQICQWVNTLWRNEDEVVRIIAQIREETAAFAAENVPRILDVILLERMMRL